MGRLAVLGVLFVALLMVVPVLPVIGEAGSPDTPPLMDAKNPPSVLFDPTPVDWIDVFLNGDDIVILWNDLSGNMSTVWSLYRSTDRFQLGNLIANPFGGVILYVDTGANLTLPDSGYWYIIRRGMGANQSLNSSQAFVVPMTISTIALPMASSNLLSLPYCDAAGGDRFPYTIDFRNWTNSVLGEDNKSSSIFKQIASWDSTMQAVGPIYFWMFVFESGNFRPANQQGLYISGNAGTWSNDTFPVTGVGCGLSSESTLMEFASNPPMFSSLAWFGEPFATNKATVRDIHTAIHDQDPLGLGVVGFMDNSYLQQMATWNVQTQSLDNIYNNPFGTFWGGDFAVEPGVPIGIWVNSPVGLTWTYQTEVVTPFVGP